MISRIDRFSTISLLIIFHHVASGEPYLKCEDSDLVVYSLTFETYWTRQNFPKQYPEYRPPAHWSKLIGMTHNKGYTLFRIGEMANKDIKLFAETGKSDFFGMANDTLDEFYSPSIKSGAGKSEVNFFADGNHTMVSLAVKIVPSPDWFVGVDSLVLCNEGNWIDAVTLEANPIDAGTDSGFTFTAPNWATEPQEEISEITSRYPRHPANSFFYPQLNDLPTIATFRIKKKKLYHLVKARESAETQPSTTPLPVKTETTSSAFGYDVGTTDNEVIPMQHKPYKHKSFKRKRKLKKLRFTGEKCQMENWSRWSNCDNSCGTGHARRMRKSVKPSKRCQTMTQEKKCSDYSGCYGKFVFKWRR